MRNVYTKSLSTIVGVSAIILSGYAALACADEEVYTLRFQHSYPPTMSFYQNTGEGLIERVEDWSDGRIQFETYEAGALASVGDMLQATADGRIDIGLSYGAFYVGDVPEANVEIGLPFAWREPYEVYDAYYNRGLKDVISESYESRFNVKYFPAVLGFQYAIMTRDDVSELDDLRGLKLRAPGIYGEYLEGLGASPTVIPGDEMYSALQMGTVDGAIYDAESAVSTGVDEFLSSAIVDPHLNAGAGHFLINGDTWDELPEELQKIIADAVQYGGAAQAMNYRAKAEISVGKIREAGVNIVSLSDEDRTKGLETAVDLWDNVATRTERAAEAVEITKEQLRDYGRME